MLLLDVGLGLDSAQGSRAPLLNCHRRGVRTSRQHWSRSLIATLRKSLLGIAVCTARVCKHFPPSAIGHMCAICSLFGDSALLYPHVRIISSRFSAAVHKAKDGGFAALPCSSTYLASYPERVRSMLSSPWRYSLRSLSPLCLDSLRIVYHDRQGRSSRCVQ